METVLFSDEHFRFLKCFIILIEKLDSLNNK
jgi:hypothetical protein